MTEPGEDTLIEHRLPDPTDIGEGSFAKSRETRRRILEASVHCLAESGYASTSTTMVANRAGLTRAAMLYHYPSKAALVEATVHYVTRARVEMYAQAMASIPHGEDYFGVAIDMAWEHLQTPEFRAFKELSAAARTDAEVAAVFTPALVEYDRARRATARRLFPSDHNAQPWFDLRRDIVRFLLEGLADEPDGLSFAAEQRRHEILAFLKALSTTKQGDALLAIAQKLSQE